MRTLVICTLLAILQGCSTMAEKNEDVLRSLYPVRETKWNKPIPPGFLEYVLSGSSNWLLVEHKGNRQVFLDLRSVKERRDSPIMYGVFKTVKPKKMKLFNKRIVEEYSWRAVNCALGGAVVFKSMFLTDNDEYLQFTYPEKDLPLVSQKDLLVDIACVKL